MEDCIYFHEHPNISWNTEAPPPQASRRLQQVPGSDTLFSKLRLHHEMLPNDRVQTREATL